MKKIFFQLFIVIMLVFGLASPVQAAPSNPITGLKNTLQRLYLRIIPGAKPGKTVLNQSMASLESLDSFIVNSVTQVEIIGQENTSSNLNLEINGPVELSTAYDPTASRQQLDIKANWQMADDVMDAQGQLIVDQSDTYIRLSEVPSSGPANLETIKDQWLHFALEPVEVNDSVDELSEEKVWELHQAAQELVKSAQVSKARKDNYNGNPVFVVEVEIPDAALAAYSAKVAEIANQAPNNQIPDGVELPDDFDANLGQPNLEQQLGNLSPIKVKLWIDQKTFYVRHLEMPLEVTMPSQPVNGQAMTTDPLGLNLGNPELYKINIMADLDQFNQPVNIQAPDESRDAAEALFGLIGGVPNFDPEDFEGALLPGITPEEVMMDSMEKPQIPELPELTPQQKQLLEQYGYGN